MTEAGCAERQTAISPVIHSLGEKRLQVAFYIFFAWVASFLLACFALFHVCLLSCVFLHSSPSKMDSDNENQVEHVFTLLLCRLRGFNLWRKCSWTRPRRPQAHVNQAEFREEWDRETDSKETHVLVNVNTFVQYVILLVRMETDSLDKTVWHIYVREMNAKHAEILISLCCHT